MIPRKEHALELLAEGKSRAEVLSEIKITKGAFRQWKVNDKEFASRWNDLMNQHGRIALPYRRAGRGPGPDGSGDTGAGEPVSGGG